MSWRDIARRARAHEEPPERECDAAPTPARDYAREERAAIAECDGGLPPQWAATLALIEDGQRPTGVSERDWRAWLDCVWQRADEHGAEFAANGWTFEEVFGLGDHFWRLDERGVAWVARDARVVLIDPDRIVLERGRARLTHHKPGRAH